MAGVCEVCGKYSELTSFRMRPRFGIGEWHYFDACPECITVGEKMAPLEVYDEIDRTLRHEGA